MHEPPHPPEEPIAASAGSHGGPQHRSKDAPHPLTAGLALAALGAVYGDIGTSPLYALRECFHGVNGISVTRPHVLGVLSCIIWSLILVISVKYLAWLMRADNRGEGGILALMALVMRRSEAQGGTLRRGVLLVGILGAGLVFGDGIITPAVSVLSAVEGLSVATDTLNPFVVPIALAIIVVLFLLQRYGTGRVGRAFGPVTLIWFLTLAVMGVHSLAQNPDVLRAVNPAWALGFVTGNGMTSLLVLGSVFLAVTGGENLYMDMGHFGARPIRLAWFTIVLPSLLLNYLGQGALLLRDPLAASHPFYALAPGWALLPLVGLAMVACAIASQAVISGIFSLTRQAIQLGYVPRMNVVHTSEQEIGQVYVPAMNWALLTGVVALVLAFGTSSALAGLYGVAVSILMLLGTLLGFMVYRQRFGWPLWAAVALVGLILVIEVSFVSANLLKIFDGGLIPLMVALAIFTLMTTWKRGRRILSERTRGAAMPLSTFLDNLRDHPPLRVPGTAVFMTGNADGTPTALLHNLKHNKVLHERLIFLTIRALEVPRVPAEERMHIEELAENTWRVVVQHGFVETVTMPRIVRMATQKGLALEMMQTTFFLGRETLIPTKRPGMALWRESLFALMSRNARSATAYFKLPPNRVVELGTQVEL
ncbi:MAG TPA: potassium transporter Kup [Myxococcaceae bacterium]|nr:potassium transporter Kup [Myxococcaceae bacterium]